MQANGVTAPFHRSYQPYVGTQVALCVQAHRVCGGQVYRQGLCSHRTVPRHCYALICQFLQDPRLMPSKAWGPLVHAASGGQCCEPPRIVFCPPLHPLAETSWAFPTGPWTYARRWWPPAWGCVIGCLVGAQINEDRFGLPTSSILGGRGEVRDHENPSSSVGGGGLKFGLPIALGDVADGLKAGAPVGHRVALCDAAF